MTRLFLFFLVFLRIVNIIRVSSSEESMMARDKCAFESSCVVCSRGVTKAAHTSRVYDVVCVWSMGARPKRLALFKTLSIGPILLWDDSALFCTHALFPPLKSGSKKYLKKNIVVHVQE